MIISGLKGLSLLSVCPHCMGLYNCIVLKDRYDEELAGRGLFAWSSRIEYPLSPPIWQCPLFFHVRCQPGPVCLLHTVISTPGM